jgi:Cu/Ag efflux pump CusA
MKTPLAFSDVTVLPGARGRRKATPYVNESRRRSMLDAAIKGSIRWHRPILMTAAAVPIRHVAWHGIGSESQRSFAIVFVGGMMVACSSRSLCCRHSPSGELVTMLLSRCELDEAHGDE